MSASRTAELRLVLRARMVLRCVEGAAINQIAAAVGVTPNKVITWRDRFIAQGLEGLRDRPRSGKPRIYPVTFRQQVLETLELPPPSGQATWDGPAVAAHLGASKDAVWRVLRQEGICLQRQRSWCISTDPEFAAKAADIVGMYLNPPENALVISVDEKPSIQALERRTGYVQTTNGQIVRGYRSTYKRHGTLNLFAALQVATGAIHAETTTTKRRVGFLAFMDQVLAGLPSATEIHVIVDNHSIHKHCDAWLSEHPQVTFHFTPTSASWLNMVEIWIGLLSRKALRGGLPLHRRVTGGHRSFHRCVWADRKAVCLAKAGSQRFPTSRYYPELMQLSTSLFPKRDGNVINHLLRRIDSFAISCKLPLFTQ